MKRQITIGLLMFICSSSIVAAKNPVPLSADLSRSELFERWLKSEGLVGEGAGALPPTFQFPEKARENSVFGMDLSHHNFDNCKCKFNWSAFKEKKIVFGYLKATQGYTYFDNKFQEGWKGLGGAGIYRGAYHFLAADVDPKAQANWFLQFYENAKKNDNTEVAKLNLPPVVDLEWDYNSSGVDKWSKIYKNNPTDIVKRLHVFVDIVKEKTGQAPLIYTNRAWWRDTIKDESLADEFKSNVIWIADYSAAGLATEVPKTPNSATWGIWQFSERASINSVGEKDNKGIKIDANIAFGDIVAFKKLMGLQ